MIRAVEAEHQTLPPPASTLEDRAERLVEALAEYHGAVDAGNAPSRDDFLQRYPEIAQELAGYLDGFDFVREIAPQLRGEEEGVNSTPTIAARATLGDFQILREIGRGGMGVVYEAEQISLGRRVALKVLPFAAMLDKQQLTRFKNESRAAATLDHPNIVAIYSVGTERGVHYYAMQLIEGQSLAQMIAEVRRVRGMDVGVHIADGPGAASFAPPAGGTPRHPEPAMSPDAETKRDLQAVTSTLPAFDTREYFRAVAQLGIQAAEALDHAHQNGVLHRDIKPANLLVDDAGKLKITDFGLARLEADAGMTMTGDILGTLRYMSPEQALAKRAVVDHRSDIYSLGVTLYELLTLEPVYQGNDRQELLRQIALEDPRRPRRVNSRIPQDLETIVLKAIEKNPNDRYVTAQQLADDLERFLDHAPIKARPPSLFTRASKWIRRHQVAVLAFVVVLAMTTLCLAVSSLLILRERDDAVAARSQAADHFQLARGAVDKLMTRVAEEELLNTPQLEHVRKALLTDALEFYQQLLNRDTNNATLRYEVAMAQRRVGQILWELGRRDDAVHAYIAAVSRFRQLAREYPEQIDYKFALAQTVYDSGRSLEDFAATYGASEQDVRSMADSYEEAIILMEVLYRASPKNSEYAIALAKAYRRSARPFGLARPDIERLTRAKEVLGPFANGADATTAQKMEYATILAYLGYVGRRGEVGRQAYDEATRILRAALQTDSKNVSLRDALAMALNNSANDFPPETNDEHVLLRKEQVAISESLAKDFPSVPHHRYEWALALAMLGKAFDRAGDPASAMIQLTEAKRIQDRLCQDYPQFKDYRDRLEMVHVLLLEVQQKYYSIDEWLPYAKDLSQLVLQRAERFDDSAELLNAGITKWHIAKRLIELGRSEQGAEWAQECFQHIRIFLQRSNRIRKESVNDVLQKFYGFCVELRAAGFAQEAVEFARNSSLPKIELRDSKQLGDYYAGLRGDYSEAARHYQAAARKSPNNSGLALRAAFLLLKANDRAGYEAMCRQMMDRFGSTQDRSTARETCWACVISRQTVGDIEQLSRLAEFAVQAPSAAAHVLECREGGLTAYRAGDWEGALKLCAESRSLAKRDDSHVQVYDAQNLLVEAMALQQLGKTREAKAAYDQASRLLHERFPHADVGSIGVGPDWIGWMAFELMRPEVEALLRIPARTDPQTTLDSSTGT